MKQGCHINGKLLRHIWTREERTVLALLFRFYDNQPDELLRVFNYINKDILIAEGYESTGIPLAAMRAQVWEMKHGGVGSDVWNGVTVLSLSQARKVFRDHKDVIEEAAQHLRIRLLLGLGTPLRDMPQAAHVKLSTATGQTQVKSLSAKTFHSNAVAQASDWDDSTSDEDDQEQKSPYLQRQMALSTSDPGKQTLNATLIRSFTFDTRAQTSSESDIRATGMHERHQVDKDFNFGRPRDRPQLVTHESNGPGSPKQPALLFRAFLPAHGFQARKFLLNSNAVPPPPPMASETFLEIVDPHLRDYLPQNATYPSPFLSLAESPERALKRMVNSQLPLELAIFNSNEVTQDGVTRYGSLCQPYPYLVRAITKKHELNDLPGGYTGVGEYLAWGSIECKPIAIIDNGVAKGLHRAMCKVKRRGMSWETGELIGPLVHLVSDKWKETFVYKLLRAFEVPGYKGGPKGDNYNELIDAVYAVNRGDRAKSVFSEATEITPTKTRIVVEIPVPARSTSKTGKRRAEEAQIEWKVPNDHQSGRQVSTAFPKVSIVERDDSKPMSPNEVDDLQQMPDAQLQPDGVKHGFTLDSTSHASSIDLVTPPSLFLRQLQQQADLLPLPPPIPPAGYRSSPVELAGQASTSSDTIVIDLCDEDEDADADANDEPRELAYFDLTHNQDYDEEEDCVVIGLATRSRGSHTAFSIRSRSLSNAINTPTRPQKRARSEMDILR